MASGSELNFTVSAEDKASKVFKDVGKSADKLADTVDDVAQKVGSSAESMASDVESGFTKAGGIFKEFGTEIMAGAAAGVGAAAGGVMMGAMAEAMARESGNAKLAAQLGLPPELARQAGAAAGKIYAGAYGESLTDVNDAIGLVAKNIRSLDEGVTPEIEGITKSILDMSDAFGIDMVDSTAAVGQLMRTGLATDATHAMDLITRGFQQGIDKSGDFLELIEEYSTEFRAAGLSGEQAFGLIQQGLKAGARDADITADAIKEFAIRAIDGSKLSGEGFKALGLSQKQMAAEFAQGGPKAAAVLGLTLDKLKAMKDPVKQAAAGVALFGTKSEDMQAALLSLDVSKASGELGKVEGSVKKVGDVLGGTTAAKFESFKRTAYNTFMDAGTAAFEFAAAMSDQLAPAFEVMGSAAKSTWEWMSKNKDIMIAIAAVVGVATVAFAGQAIATGIWATVAGWATAATGALTTGFWSLTAAILMNPIGMIVIAVAALVAALVIAYKRSDTFRRIVDRLWKAIKDGAVVVWGYVKPVLIAIGNAFITLWNNYIKPYLGFIFGLYVKVFKGLKIAWEQFLKPAFIAIGQAAMWLWNNAIKPAFFFILGAWKAVFAGAKILWETVLKPVFLAIAATCTWLWSTVIVPAFNVIKYIITNVFIAIKGIWNSILMPVFRTIGSIVGWLWRVVIVPAFNRMKVAWSILVIAFKFFWNTILMPVFRAVGTIAKWLWEKVLSPTWNAIKKGWSLLMIGLKFVWDNVLKPVFNALGVAVGVIKDKFDIAVKGIGKIWDGLKKIVHVPIKFVIDTIINKGIIGSWNWISKNVLGGAFEITGRVPVPALATGGIMPGYTPGRDNQLIAVSGGEAIMRPEWTRAVGADRINEWNSAARHGGISGVSRQLGFADGGIFGSVKALGAKVWETAKSTVKGVADFMSNPMAFIRKLIKPFLDQMSKFKDTQIGKGITGVAGRLIDRVAETAKSFKFGPNPATIDNGDGRGALMMGPFAKGTIGAMHQWGMSQAGKRYSFGAVGPGSYDCSGLAGNFYAMATGRSMYRRYMLANTQSMDGVPGIQRGRGASMTFLIGGVKGSGHVTTRINGTNFEAFGGNGVPLAIGRIGTPTSYFHTPYHVPGFAKGGSVLRNANKGLDSFLENGWPEPFLFDKGGLLQPGLTLALNRTGRPEEVRPRSASTDAISAPIVIKLDSKTVYQGLLKLRRGMGGSWELSS